MRQFLLLLILILSAALAQTSAAQTHARNRGAFTAATAQDSAAAIIDFAIEAKNCNDPQQQLQTFKFKSYSKLLITANPDSIRGKIDSVMIKKRRREFVKIDSSDYKFKKLISNQHLFLTEKVSVFEFANGRLKETILGTKMAGFKQPIYEVIGFDLQSFSIYDKTYELFETSYRSPIANDATSAYDFILRGTTTIDSRPVYIIAFSRKGKRQTSRLFGELYIDSANFAIARAVMRSSGIVNISASHDYEFVPDLDLWFPTSREFRIVKGSSDDDIRIFGQTLHFRSEGEMGPKTASDFTYLQSTAHFFEPQYNIPLRVAKSAIRIQIPDAAIAKPESFWDQYHDGDLRAAATYKSLDSIASKERVEPKLRFGRKILNGYVPLGPFDVDLRHLLSFNNYEGFRLGFGGITNERFSQKYRLEGYTAYGTKDGNFKYNAGGAVRIGKFSDTWIGAGYTDDVREIASTTFAIDRRIFKIYDPRPINVSTFYNHVSWRGYIETKIIPKTESIWQITHSYNEPKFGYTYLRDGKPYTDFKLTTAMVSFQWNPYSGYMQTPAGRDEIDKRFPKFTFQFTQALPYDLGSNLIFSKVDLRAEYQKKFLDGQKTSVLFEGGYAYGDVPITHAYNTSPNNLNQDNLLARITLAGKNSFETMYFNEFFSNKYALLQFKHGFRKFTLMKKVRPTPVVVTRMAWGAMDNPGQHYGFEYKTLNDGYFESGIELNGIFKGFGLSGFYRYGPYQLAHLEDNLSIKISFVLDVGL